MAVIPISKNWVYNQVMLTGKYHTQDGLYDFTNFDHSPTTSTDAWHSLSLCRAQEIHENHSLWRLHLLMKKM